MTQNNPLPAVGPVEHNFRLSWVLVRPLWFVPRGVNWHDIQIRERARGASERDSPMGAAQVHGDSGDRESRARAPPPASDM